MQKSLMLTLTVLILFLSTPLLTYGQPTDSVKVLLDTKTGKTGLFVPESKVYEIHKGLSHEQMLIQDSISSSNQLRALNTALWADSFLISNLHVQLLKKDTMYLNCNEDNNVLREKVKDLEDDKSGKGLFGLGGIVLGVIVTLIFS